MRAIVEWLALAALIIIAQSIPQITVYPSLNTINQLATYVFTLNIGDTSILPGTATLAFDSSVYTFTNSSGVTGCYDSTDSSILYNCSASSSSSISFKWSAAMGVQMYLNISSIKNPSYVSNFDVTLSFVPNGGGSFTSVVGTINSLQPDTLSSCSMTYSPSYANSYSAVTFSIVNKNPVPTGGSLQLTFNGFTPGSTPTNLAISTTTSAAFINTTALTSSVGVYYAFSNFFKAAVPAATTLNFTLSSFLNPPTTASGNYSITILTYASTSYQNKIDQKICSISGITDYPTPSLTVYSTGTLKVGATKASVLVDFKSPTLINFATDTISVQVSSSSTTYLLVYCLSIAVSTNVTGGNALTCSNSSNGVLFPGNAPSTTIALNTATSISSGIFLNSVVNSGTKTITVQFFRSGSSYSSNSATITVLPNTLTAAAFTPASTLVLTSTTYSFTMQTKNPLGVGAVVVVTVPTNITIASGACSVSVSLSVSSSLSSVIGCSASGQAISISNISTTTLPGSTTITLNVSGITNPAVTKTTGSIFYQTYYGLNETVNPVDDSTGFSLTLSPSSVTIPNGYFSVARADTTNLKYTTYTFSYKVYTSFPATGIIYIVMSNYMQLSAGATASYVLSTNATNQSLPVTSTTNSTATTLTLTFSNATTIPANTVFTIVVSNILNYYSYKPINLQLLTYTSDGYQVEQSNPAATSINNNAPDTSLVASDANTNTINGNTISYLFSIKTTSLLNPTDLISIELQLTNNVTTQLLYSSSVTCKLNATTVACSKDLTNTKLLYVTVGSTFTSGTVLSVTVSSITLTRSMDQPGSITVTTLEVSAGTNYVISTSTFLPAPNTKPNLINNAKLAINDNGISSARLDVATSFTLSFQPSNLLITGDYVVVNIPSSDWTFQTTAVVVSNLATIGTMTGSLCTNSNVFCSNYNGDSYKIRVDDKTGTAFPSVTNISFTLASTAYVSTKNWADTYSLLTFNTYTKANFSIDSSTNSTSNTASFTLACPNTSSLHCKTCSSAGLCLSCYRLGDGVDTTWNFGGYNMLQSTDGCVITCGVQYFNSSNICQPCTAPCYSCTISSTNCTSCIAPTVRINTTCNASCPTGYFNSSSVCMQCSSPCATCVNTSSTCQSCNNGTYLNANTCAANCNGLTGYFPNNSTWACEKCITNCSACSGSASNCTTCASDYFLLAPGTCAQSCPNGTVKVSSTLCTCNYTACNTCALTINTCTSCLTGLLLLNSACATSCGAGYYVNNSNCIACPTNCNNCTASGCTICSTTANYLYNNICYSTCPSGTTGSLNTCISCPSGCSVCSNSTVCTTCQSIYYLVVNSDLSSGCVSSCPTQTPYVQASKCVSNCTPPLILNNSFCISNSSNSNNTNSTNGTSSQISSKVVPMPVTISLFILGSVSLISKCTFQSTIVWGCLSAFGGLCELIAWFIFIVVVITDSTAGVLSKTGMIVVIAAFVITLILNCISLYFFKKYVWVDDKFQSLKRKLRKTRCSLSMTYFFVGISIVFSHKWLDILFSNLFQANHCIYKVSIVNKLTPLNFIRYASILASIIAIGGAAVAGYDTQSYKAGSIIFMQSIDLIVVTVVSCVLSIVATKRNPEDYENISGLKRNDMEDEFQHDPVQQDINHFEKEERRGSYRDKYKYSSSIRNNDPKENPLSKRNPNYKNPIGEENNLTNVPLDNHDDDNNRISLNDITGMSSGIFKKKRIEGIDVQEIQFVEESGDSMLPIKSKNPNNKFSNRYGVSESQRMKRQVEEREHRQKQKLKDNIQSKLNELQRQKARVINEVDAISTALLSERHGENSELKLDDLSKNERKKEKLDALLASGEDNLSKLSEKEREKAGEIKDAINMLKAKKIAIDDYLQYLDIIEQEDEEKNSNDYDNKNLASKMKNKGVPMSSNTKSKNLVKSLRKNERIERSARYKKDTQIFVQHQNDTELGRGRRISFDQQKEPQLPVFHQTTIPRNRSEQLQLSELQELRLSGIRTLNNRSDQQFKKGREALNDKFLNSLQSGDNDDPGLADQFRRGNTLKQVQKDDLPPSSSYVTQRLPQIGDSVQTKLPPSKDPNRIGPNRLMNNQDRIQYIESQGGDVQTLKGEFIGFDNDVGPSRFDEPNKRIENEKSSNAPTKPKMAKDAKQGVDGAMYIEDLEDAYDEFQNQQRQQGEPSKLQRYQSDRNLDYDEILMQQRRSQKQKQLQKIYLPRLDVGKANKVKKKVPKPLVSGRSEQK